MYLIAFCKTFSTKVFTSGDLKAHSVRNEIFIYVCMCPHTWH